MSPGYTPPTRAADEALMKLLTRALDEIYALRRALAYEASVTDAHHESYKTFPKSRKRFAVAQAERMRLAARGSVEVAYADASSLSLRHSLREAGAAETLTRWQWEAERV